MRSKIEWTDVTWNPITGCSKVSTGCKHCFAERMAKRLAGRFGYPADEPFRVTFHGDKLADPQRWRKPRRIFVCSMSDLWHPDVQPEDRAAVIRATNLAPQHTYLFLTKRPERFDGDWSGQENFWFGTSCEDQPNADKRIPHLLAAKVRNRFLSLEPLLASIRFPLPCRDSVFWSGIHWVIVGGESGPGSRPCNLDWIRSIVRQCQEASVSCFVKQIGVKPIVPDSKIPPSMQSWWYASQKHDSKGGEPSEWPKDLRIRQWPSEAKEPT